VWHSNCSCLYVKISISRHSVLSLFNNKKTQKTNGFDTIEIDLRI
jgi:hypothetical protein